MSATESHYSKNVLEVQHGCPLNSVLGGQGAGGGSSLRLHGNGQHPEKCEKDSNFNFLEHEDELLTGDENRNQLRLRLQNLQGREPLLPSTHFGPMSPLSRLPSWSPLEPLPEIEVAEEACGRVPPEGAEGKMEEEENVKEEEEVEDSKEVGEEEDEEEEEDWEESDSEFEFSYRSSSSSSSSLSMEGKDGSGRPEPGWRGVPPGGGRGEEPPERGNVTSLQGRIGDGQSIMEMKNSQSEGGSSDSDTDTCPELHELMEAMWTLRDQERFKAQEMERHQVQLTMYRRLALIRWVRSLQGRVQEQQDRLQSSFDVILTHRKELLRMGAGMATPTSATVSQS
ncbi:UPF0500 protein C1orf216 isoform X1 [Brienomyrus brachyistius]|uniref:UPF0500 protein C1orf216 isoform X1 n=1 Tax=Brienomyrus brachyistius TaxID=42636 RepID=UPI0020B40B9E|nr:UPF0500 protein C1orf216 isoform X1 [Brienomyrus brachyistius]